MTTSRESPLDRWLARVAASGLFSSLEGLVVECPVVVPRDQTRPFSVIWSGRAEVSQVSSSGGCGGKRPDLWDLASLTKPTIATLALLLFGRHELGLPLNEAAHLKDFEISPWLRRGSLEGLFRHRSRLAAWAPLYELCRSPEQAVRRLLAGEWGRGRLGTYSDLGYVLAGLALERSQAEPLGALVSNLLAAPLGLDTPRYRPLLGSEPLADDRCVSCSIDTAAEVALAERMYDLKICPLPPPSTGEVQDGNARFLGPVGHAGLFATANDLATLATAWLPGSWAQKRLGLRPERIAWALAGSGRRRFGWEARTTRNSSGPSLPASAFGHTGFVGGSLWVDPDRRRVSLLLGHRMDPFSELNRVRRQFHGLAHAELPDGPEGQAR